MFKAYKGFIIGIIMGALLMTALPSMAATTKQTYSLTDATYPIVVNGSAYVNSEQPVMNYKGTTYVPLKAFGEMMGADVIWDEVKRQVEVRHDGAPNCNSAFCHVKVSGSGGTYTVTGEGRVFEAVMAYAVEDGHNYLLESFHTLDSGAPAWSPFQLEIVIPEEQLPENGTLILELFEYSAKDGSKINTLIIPLETFSP
ncbi:Gmad2 immunoglobulin-like domain-containing protein [Paenibacillus nanensis]|uniref:Gmad2 immunoglobulin-like domain-containing protein n=1 Tax=Paenibacillus nanensis TaxID=393251 RepID=UPI0013C2C167|nr:Gmad2 immunoglobulin-like domain-containing protein [Paenibacillus nanensis]